MRANVKSSRQFIGLVMFDLQLEWTVGAGGWGRENHSPTLTPLLIFDRRPPPWQPLVQIYFTPQPFAVVKIKDGGHNICQNYASQATHEATCRAASCAPDLVQIKTQFGSWCRMRKQLPSKLFITLENVKIESHCVTNVLSTVKSFVFKLQVYVANRLLGFWSLKRNDLRCVANRLCVCSESTPCCSKTTCSDLQRNNRLPIESSNLSKH